MIYNILGLLSMLIFKNFTEAYYDLVDLVYNDTDHEVAPRGMKIKERLGVFFEIQMPRNRLLYVPERKFSLPYTIAETLWYLTGDNTTEWISEYSSFWKKISEDGKAHSAYGQHIFGKNNIPLSTNPIAVDSNSESQWEYVLRELRNDPDSRRAVMHIRQPKHSWIAEKDVPCTLTLQFILRDNKLNLITNMRSSDLIYGLSYDVPAFTFLQELMALELGVELGWYRHLSASLHIYERHFEMCENIMKNDPRRESWVYTPQMPEMPSPPPIDYLNKVQWKLRDAATSDELEELVNMFNPDVPAYWNDWVNILAVRKAKKLKATDLKNRIHKNISFAGYKAVLK